MAPELYILRHGETEWNVARRMQGRRDSPLTGLGLAQAAAQAEILRRRGVSGRSHAHLASPQGRAVTTARIVCAATRAPLHLDARLAEIDMGDWTGLTLDEIDARSPGLFETHPGTGWYAGIPGGEGFGSLLRRAADLLGGLTRPAVLVTHGMMSAALRCAATGLPAEAIPDQPGGQGIVWHVGPRGVERLE